MSALHPIDAAVLAEYWLGTLAEFEEAAVEEHLFACDECGARLREVIALAQELRRLAREGSLTMVVSDAFVRRAADQGMRVREYSPPPSGSIQCTVTAEDDFLIGHLTADLSAARRVDLSLCDRQGVEQHRLLDIPFNAQAPAVTFQQSITYAKAAPSDTMIARLIALDENGVERVLGEYTFQHTRTIPGPAAW
jgi:anti-sigma factor RsiW